MMPVDDSADNTLMQQPMHLWSDDLSQCSLEDVLKLELDNRAWNKTLRLQTSTLVNTRLANQIDRDGYMAGRRNGQQNSIECKRRADLLGNEIACRQENAGLSHSGSSQSGSSQSGSNPSGSSQSGVSPSGLSQSK